MNDDLIKITDSNGKHFIYNKETKKMIEDLLLQLFQMEEICKKTYCVKTKSDLSELRDKLDKLFYLNPYIYLMDCIEAPALMSYINYNKIYERDIQEKFRKNLLNLIPNSKLIKRKNDFRHVPDEWIIIDNEEIPVEIKLYNFDKKALRQLQRYMNFYKCNKGVAVARYLTCELPSNITFVNASKMISGVN